MYLAKNVSPKKIACACNGWATNLEQSYSFSFSIFHSVVDHINIPLVYKKNLKIDYIKVTILLKLKCAKDKQKSLI